MPDTRTTIRDVLYRQGLTRFGEVKKHTIYKRTPDNSGLARLLRRMIKDGWIRKVSRDHNFYYGLTSSGRKKIEGAWEHSSKLAGELFRYVNAASVVDLRIVAERIGIYALTAIVKARGIKDEDDRDIWLNESMNLLSLYNSLYNDSTEEGYRLTKDKLLAAFPDRSLDLLAIAFLRQKHVHKRG